MGEGGFIVECRCFFPLQPICFLETLSFNKSLIRRITHNPPATARWLQLEQAHAHARPPHFYPPSALGRRLEFTHSKPSPQPNNSTQHPPPLFFRQRQSQKQRRKRSLWWIGSDRQQATHLSRVFRSAPSPPTPTSTEGYRLFKVIISFAKSLSRTQLLWAIGEKN